VDNHDTCPPSYKQLGLDKPEEVTEDLLQRFPPSTARKGQRVAQYSTYGDDDDDIVKRWDYGTITSINAKHRYFYVKYDEFPTELCKIHYELHQSYFGIKPEVHTWCLGKGGE
jgi:hypothetical protein